MKHACPRCHERGIPEFAKRWSSRASPAECAKCGGLSHVLASTSNGIWVGTLLAFVVSLVVAAGFNSGLIALSGICLVVAFNARAWKRAMLVPIPKENAKAATAANWIVAGIYAFFALFGS